MGDWTFFSNYGHVLVCLAKNHEARLRDVAAQVGITERAVQKIVRDMQDAGFLIVSKQGRCNRYRINKRKALRHDLVANCTVGQLLAQVTKPGVAAAPAEIEAGTEPQVKAGEKVKAAAPQKPAEAARETQAKKRPDAPPAEPEPAAKPLDTRQQGSLF